jgi:hypothetical protein
MTMADDPREHLGRLVHDLSPAARDVLHELESFDRLNPGLNAPALVWHLARKWIPGWLKRPRWWRR